MSEKSRYHGGTKRERCYLCDSRGPLEEHHIVPQRLGGADTQKNIVDVCQLCHKRLEKLYNSRFYAALGIDDPRGGSDTHLVCGFHGCTEEAETTVTFTGVGEVTKVTEPRCPEHLPDEDNQNASW